MAPLHPRQQTIQSSIEFQLRPLISAEAVEILARTMAHIIHRDPRQFPQLTDLFREAFSIEHKYLCSRPAPGGPDGFRRSSTSASHE
jgi:hypothetical protein